MIPTGDDQVHCTQQQPTSPWKAVLEAEADYSTRIRRIILTDGGPSSSSDLMLGHSFELRGNRKAATRAPRTRVSRRVEWGGVRRV